MDKEEGLKELRKPFPATQISKLPRVTCKNCRDSRTKNCSDHSKSKCRECNNWISSAHMHLDYVGHAELTSRLLDVDPDWSWEPLAFDADGLPAYDKLGGMWIKLTVLGVTRLGYGDAGDKSGPNAIKEIIGDALRNSGMRFGLALDLWAKSDLSSQVEETSSTVDVRDSSVVANKMVQKVDLTDYVKSTLTPATEEKFNTAWRKKFDFDVSDIPSTRVPVARALIDQFKEPKPAQPTKSTEKVNLSKLLMSELTPEQRPIFAAWLERMHNCGIGAVPADKVPEVETAISHLAAGEVLGGEPFA